jgi:indole-3-glycerol phosphate synthase
MSFLSEIMDVKKDEVAKLKQHYTLLQFAESEYFDKKTLSLKSALTQKQDIGILAEIKKASPSKGLIRQDFNHMEIANTYFENKVDAVSVLTDRIFFQGDITYLRDIASIKSVPLLRKDFLIHEYQIFEAKSNGADIVLLIAEALSKNQIQELTCAADEIGLETLLEFHSENQLKKIDFDRNDFIGINNRNLDDFSTDLNSTVNISRILPANVILISESGIREEEDIEILRQTPTAAILVGEHLMSAADISKSLQELKEWCRNAR